MTKIRWNAVELQPGAWLAHEHTLLEDAAVFATKGISW